MTKELLNQLLSGIFSSKYQASKVNQPQVNITATLTQDINISLHQLVPWAEQIYTAMEFQDKIMKVAVKTIENTSVLRSLVVKLQGAISNFAPAPSGLPIVKQIEGELAV